jgi:transposase InsO family protein
VQVALRIWCDDPEMSLTFLLAQLDADPELRLKDRGVVVSRSTLHRYLQAHDLYRHLRKLAKKTRAVRTRYSPRTPHDIWHLDAKGPFDVKLASGAIVVVHVMTVLDGASRAVLACLIVPTPDLKAAVRVFQSAARRWGLPERVACDRASIFDSHAFRAGLALLGVHRIWTRSRNPEANGKIEAYHRCLAAWFVRRLPKQVVVDLVHLEQLLLAMVEVIYQDHRHRELKATPRAVLDDRVSPRIVPAPRLVEAFRASVVKKAHPKTGEVDLGGKKYLVPPSLRGRRLTFLVDPAEEAPLVVVEPSTEKHIPLTPVAVAPTARKLLREVSREERRGDGPLQRLYDQWQGQIRPIAEAGFGLPELLRLLADAAKRHVPMSDDEAALVHRVYQSIGPLGRAATEKAFAEIVAELGPQRPLMAYLDALKRRVRHSKEKKR